MTWPAIVLWLLIGLGAVSRRPLLLYLFSTTAIFGDLTVLPLGLTGGLNLQPQTLCAMLLVGKFLLDSRNRNEALRLAFDFRQLGLLTAFLVYAALTSVVLPRLFNGEVMVYSLNAAASETPLTTTSANFSQIIYLSLSVCMVFVFAGAVQNRRFLQHYLNAILLTGVLLVVSGILDLVLTTSGHANLLSPFHNAGYNLLSDVSLAGQTRVVGFMPEASVYGQVCCFILSFLVFNYGAFSTHARKLLLPLTIIAMIVLTFLSTSSTGYVGLFIIGAVQAARLGWEFLLGSGRTELSARRAFFAAIATISVAVLSGLVILAYLPEISRLLQVAIFQKTDSSSYIERSAWTAAGAAALAATHGIGVGVGSVRTSDFFVNLLASTGVAGALIAIIFVTKTLWFAAPDLPKEIRRFATGTKLCLLPAAAMLAASGTTPDPGVWTMSLFGLIFSATHYARRDQTYASAPQQPRAARYAGIPDDEI